MTDTANIGADISAGITPAQFAARNGVKLNTLGKAWKRKIGTPFDKDADMSVSELAMFRDYEKPVPEIPAMPPTTEIGVAPPLERPNHSTDTAPIGLIPAQAGFSVPRKAWALPTENDLINAASMAAFAWASFDLLGAFGLLFSGTGILFFVRTVRNLKKDIAHDHTDNSLGYTRVVTSRSAQFGISVCVLIEFVAGFFDYLFFRRLLSDASELPFGYTVLALGAAAFFVVMSLFALYQSWNEKLDAQKLADEQGK